MKISDILSGGLPTLSYEVFPPKTTDKFDSVREATERLAEIRPDYMSVTYGAGGSGSRFTLPIAANIEQKFGVPVIHHLTCVGSTYEDIDDRLAGMKVCGIENILALRGDVPEGADPGAWCFRHADELVAYIKAHGDFCVGGACYPEGHPESRSLDEDLDNLRRKVDAGCDFLTTQLFFDNDLFFAFYEKALAKGICVPITAGIMPITSAKQFDRITFLSGAPIPQKLLSIAGKYGDDAAAMRAAGIEFAADQMEGLLSGGVRSLHIYTMNSAATGITLRGAFDRLVGKKHHA